MVKLKQCASIGAALKKGLQGAQFSIELHVKLQVLELKTIDSLHLCLEQVLHLVHLLALEPDLVTLKLKSATDLIKLHVQT